MREEIRSPETTCERTLWRTRALWGRESEANIRQLIPAPEPDTALLPCLAAQAPVGTLNGRTL